MSFSGTRSELVAQFYVVCGKHMHIQESLERLSIICMCMYVCMVVFANNYYRPRGIINLRVGGQTMSCRVEMQTSMYEILKN